MSSGTRIMTKAGWFSQMGASRSSTQRDSESASPSYNQRTQCADRETHDQLYMRTPTHVVQLQSTDRASVTIVQGIPSALP